MSAAWPNGSTTAWRRVRAYVLQRDAQLGYRCRAHEDRWCIRQDAKPHRCSRNPTDAHHTRSRMVVGDNPEYLVSSCHACNVAIGEPRSPANPAPRRVTQW